MASDLKTQDGEFKSDEGYIAQRKLSHNQFNALLEGVDFNIDPLGNINRI
jgi:CRISPR-associated endonuclease Csn1